VLLVVVCALSAAPSPYVKKDTWQESMLASRSALEEALKAAPQSETKSFSTAVIKGGDKAVAIEVDIAGWKDLYLVVGDAGSYNHDVSNWGNARLVDAVGKETFLDTIQPTSASQEWGSFRLDKKSAVGGAMVIGGKRYDRGLGTHAKSTIHYRLAAPQAKFRAEVGVDGTRPGAVTFHVSPNPLKGAAPSPVLEVWQALERDFTDAIARRQMAWEKEDHIWDAPVASDADLAGRYAKAARGQFPAQAAPLAQAAKDAAGVAAVRELYYRSRQVEEAMTLVKDVNLVALRLAIEDLVRTFGPKYPKGAEYLARLNELEQELALTAQDAPPAPPPAAAKPAAKKAGKKAKAGPAAQPAPADQRITALAERLRRLRQEALLANPLIDFDRLIVLRRSAKNLALPHNWQSNSSIARSGIDNELMVLSPVSPEGRLEPFYKPAKPLFVGDLEMHWDARRMLLSSLDDKGRWQVFEMTLADKKLRQITGEQPDIDSYDACYTPAGKIIFNSTACFIGVPCVYGSSHVTNLYTCDADGKNIRQLCFDQEHDWCPAVLNNGRILYQRWEYSDTPHSNTRLLFHMNPDGTEQLEYYGSNSYWPNSMFYARPVPGHPTKVAAVVTGHHGVPRMGELVILDPAVDRHEAKGAVQRIPGYGKKVERVVADALVNASWPKFLHPYPLSEKYFLVSMMPKAGAKWGIYLVDVFDNMLLLCEADGQAMFEPTPIHQRPVPPVIRDKVDLARNDAVVYITDVHRGEAMRGIPPGTVKKLRLFTYHFSYQGMGGLLGVVGVDGPWDIKRIMGTVPVEADGSALFRVPANTPFAIQPLDENGAALQIMRSWMTAMPGEIVSCAGCHEKQNTVPPNSMSLAQGKPPAEIAPWYGPTRGFSYAREVQPVIDKHCVGCHDGSTSSPPGGQARNGRALPDFRGTERVKDFRMVTPGNGGGRGGKFTVGYVNLHRYLRHPGVESDYHVLTAKEFHADTTLLVQKLRKGHQGVQLAREDWERLYTWIVLNAPFHGTWGEELAKPGAQRERRNELLKKYAGVVDDPEAVHKSAGADKPVAFVAPKPLPPANKIELAGWPFDAAAASQKQAQAAAALNVTIEKGKAPRKTVELAEGVTLELVLVPAGEFVMGQADGEPDERPLAKVRIDKPFWMGRCEISNRQYACFDPFHDSKQEDKLAYQFGVHGYPANEPDQPVVRVSWRRAMEFCRWLSQKTGAKVSLPSEAQWEWACRAGTASPLSYGGLDSDFSPFANLADAKLEDFASNPYTLYGAMKNKSRYDDYLPKDTRFNDKGMVAVAVGSYQPNPFGLHDMHGNAQEWTLSTYKPYPYDGADGREGTTGAGPVADRKVVRGGSWRDRPQESRSAWRWGYPSWQQVYNVSFRVVIEAAPESKVAAK